MVHRSKLAYRGIDRSKLAYRGIEELGELAANAANAAALEIRGTCPHFTSGFRAQIQRLIAGASVGSSQKRPGY